MTRPLHDRLFERIHDLQTEGRTVLGVWVSFPDLATLRAARDPASGAAVLDIDHRDPDRYWFSGIPVRPQPTQPGTHVIAAAKGELPTQFAV